MIMTIVPITMGTAIAIITTIEAMVIITIGTGGIMGIVMAMVTITIIVATITITTGTIDAKVEFLGARSTRGQKRAPGHNFRRLFVLAARLVACVTREMRLQSARVADRPFQNS
jgi:hypothetical protein